MPKKQRGQKQRSEARSTARGSSGERKRWAVSRTLLQRPADEQRRADVEHGLEIPHANVGNALLDDFLAKRHPRQEQPVGKPASGEQEHEASDRIRDGGDEPGGPTLERAG